MTTTDTVTNATDAETQYIEAQEWLSCTICGVFVTSFDYARNTCSQDCARTAAIMEAINGWRLAAMPMWTTTHGTALVDVDVAQPIEPEEYREV